MRFGRCAATAVSVGSSQCLSTDLAPVEVIATSPLPGFGIEKNKLPYEVQSVTGEAVYRSQSLNLTEFMSRNLSGVSVNEVQGSPFQADVTYRGFRASAIFGASQGLSVYLDGVRVNEPFGDVINYDMLPEAACASGLFAPLLEMDQEMNAVPRITRRGWSRIERGACRRPLSRC